MLMIDVLVVDGGVLGEDRDAALALELAGVHDEIGDVLAHAERAALFQQRVDQRRLAVVDVGHDGDAPPVGARRHRGLLQIVRHVHRSHRPPRAAPVQNREAYMQPGVCASAI